MITLEPIGVVAVGRADPSDADWAGVVSEIALREGLSGVMQGLEEFTHALVIFWMHEGPPPTVLQRRPRERADMPLLGLLAQRARHRPNPIGVTAVEIVRVTEDRLVVRGLDAIQGTPVLDLKPYVPAFDSRPEAGIPEWVSRIMEGYF